MAESRSARRRPLLRDRRDEAAALDGLLEAARGGSSGALVVRGQPGIGKTTLLEHAVASATGFRVVRAAGVESESELAFAALHQLCAPLLDRLDRLPGPQRDALATTFGLSAGPVPDRFFVALAVLYLLSEWGEERPLLCVVDDAQWLDRASAQALGFVARRLVAESVAVVFATRVPSKEFSGLPTLLVDGLPDADARQLLASVIPGRLDEQVWGQILEETRGNPLALLELPRGLTAAQLAGGFGLPGAISLSGRIEERYVLRFGSLPVETQRLLVVAAAEPLGDPALLRRAAKRLGFDEGVLAPAEAAGLIEVDGRVRFRHPLVRSAVYGAATAELKRQAHRALAEATDARIDRDRRAWHLAEAAAGPDGEVAAELERAADRALARGGLAAAAAFLERSAALTPEPSRRTQRALAAAQAKFEAGAIDDAGALLDTADADDLDDVQRARVHLLRARIAFASSRGGDAPLMLLNAARELEAVDPALARATYLDAFEAARFAGPLSRAVGVVEVSQAALASSPPPPPPRPPDLLLEGFAILFTEGHAAAAPILKEALRAFRHDSVLPPHEARWLALACRAAADVWDDETWRLLSMRELERARQVGALTAMPLALSTLSYIHVISGDLAAAESLLDEIRAATEATGIPSHPYIALWLAALRGEEAELAKLFDTTIGEAAARGEGFLLAIAKQANAVLNIGHGRYDAALAAVREAVDVEPLSEMGSPRAVADLIEAAVRCGERQLAERGLDRLAMTTQPSGSDWALAVEARSRALLSEGDAAETLYRDAIERLQHTGLRLQLARTHLLYGEWLGGERRLLDARAQLRTALEMFTSMGTEAFAARAEHELAAMGERTRKRTPRRSNTLTAQEAQIASLAGDGLSNVEIGARLYISQHTVAYHLRKVFSKLGIASRNKLSQVLPPEPSATSVP
jgi:DNA-binding CsgD family transcriptional regulator